MTNATFLDEAKKRLDRLWEALHGEAAPADSHSLVEEMMDPWGAEKIPAAPPWLSDIGDDHSPIEYSIAFSPGKPELRFLAEAQGGTDWESMRTGASRLNETLERRGADLKRLRRVEDLFVPPEPEVRDPRFAVWHTVALSPGPLRAKAYFYPRVRGAERTAELVRTAFENLGLATAWSTVDQTLKQFRTRDFLLLCLDLQEGDHARVKVYPHPHEVRVADLEWVASLRSGYVPGEVAEFCRTMTGHEGPYFASPDCRVPICYLSFTRNEVTPSDVTVQVPIRCYVPDDSVAQSRIYAYFESRDLNPEPYRKALEAVAGRSLDAGRGLNAWVTLRIGSRPPLITVYLAAELYRAQPRG